ncbi:DUF92 domain-containing protein [Gemmatimonas phototrophica]|uniref:DUF92 domain-containing protein n=1 Tax=Gemmatimonas phototrophica TaxID=1379270 RepID=UPI001314122D|nr:DUF92 domain-containing protein [Gemmatimonas phototrophica]
MRVLTASSAAAVIAGLAWRAGSLSSRGVVAATVVGGIAMTAGATWGAFLVLWFVSASLASRYGRRAKEAATGDIVAKGGARDALQVLANGGVFAAAALVSVVWPAWHGAAAVAGAAALVAAGADTLATETGTLWRGRPWSLRTRGPVPTGSSGAVSLPGSLGMVAGAILLAMAAHWTGLVPAAMIPQVAGAGVVGAVADTVIGAFWQARRWCPSCERETEQPRHRCGTPTVAWRGVSWLSNDTVNFACTVVGAVVALLL